MGMGHDNSMIYSQDDTIIELTHKLNILSTVTGNRDWAEKGTNLGQQPVASP